MKCLQVDDVIPILLPAVYCCFVGVVLLLGGTTFDGVRGCHTCEHYPVMCRSAMYCEI